MKKIIYLCFSVLVIIGIASLFFIDFNKGDNKKDLTKVTVAEVAHSIFYAPQYAAISNGYFEEYGLDID